MPQVGIFGNCQECFGVNPTFSGMTLLNSGRNLKTWWNFEDFYAVTDAYNCGIYRAAVNGAGAATINSVAVAGRPGIVEPSTGTTAAGYAGYYARNTLALLFGTGERTYETDVSVPLLSTAIEEYILRMGFQDAMGADAVDGVYFEYDRTVNVNWLRCSADNSARTKTDTGVAVAAGAWIRLKIVVAANGLSAEFFINNVSVGTNVANIPIGAGRHTTIMQYILKTAGITARSFYIDWVWIHIDLTTSR